MPCKKCSKPNVVLAKLPAGVVSSVLVDCEIHLGNTFGRLMLISSRGVLNLPLTVMRCVLRSSSALLLPETMAGVMALTDVILKPFCELMR